MNDSTKVMMYAKIDELLRMMLVDNRMAPTSTMIHVGASERTEEYRLRWRMNLKGLDLDKLKLKRKLISDDIGTVLDSICSKFMLRDSWDHGRGRYVDEDGRWYYAVDHGCGRYVDEDGRWYYAIWNLLSGDLATFSMGESFVASPDEFAKGRARYEELKKSR